MEFKQLKTFKVATEELNFTRAAEILNYSQSNVTTQIKGLEEELGVRLFERLGRKLVLTESGEKFLIYVEKILRLAEESKQAVGNGQNSGGTLTIAAQESQCTYRLPAVLQEFRRRCPQVQLIFRPDLTDAEIRVQLHQGLLDAALLLEPPVESGTLSVEPLVYEPIVVITHPEHRLIKKVTVHPRDLEGEQIIVTEDGCHYRRKFEQTLGNAGIYPNNKLEFASVEAIKQCVIKGLGVTALPEITVKAEVATGSIRILPWIGEAFNVVTQLAWHKDKWLSPSLLSFVKVCKEVIRE